MEKKLALELVDFLYDSPSACHGVKATQKILDENGFVINGLDRYGNDFYIRKELLQ